MVGTFWKVQGDVFGVLGLHAMWVGASQERGLCMKVLQEFVEGSEKFAGCLSANLDLPSSMGKVEASAVVKNCCKPMCVSKIVQKGQRHAPGNEAWSTTADAAVWLHVQETRTPELQDTPMVLGMVLWLPRGRGTARQCQNHWEQAFAGLGR